LGVEACDGDGAGEGAEGRGGWCLGSWIAGGRVGWCEGGGAVEQAEESEGREDGGHVYAQVLERHMGPWCQSLEICEQ
jgi:hypothetical protein